MPELDLLGLVLKSVISVLKPVAFASEGVMRPSTHELALRTFPLLPLQ